MEFALVSLGDHLADPHTGTWSSQAEKYQLMVDHAVRGESAGFSAIMLGEHHFCDYILSSPPVVLGAIAARTTTLRLNTGVTLLPTLDPVRVAEDFTTLDVLSGGRAEVTVGRGILPNAYHATGTPVEASREIFAEYAGLLLRLLGDDKVTWRGTWRGPLDDVSIEPRSVQHPHLPVWIAGGSSAASVDLAADIGARLMLPGVFAPAPFFGPFADRYRERFAAAGHPTEALRIGNVFHAHVARTSQQARQRWEPYYRNYLGFVDAVWDGQLLFDGKVRPRRPFDFDRALASTAICGSPAEVTERLLEAAEQLDLDLIALSMDLGALPRDLLMESIDLVGASVIPALIGDRRA